MSTTTTSTTTTSTSTSTSTTTATTSGLCVDQDSAECQKKEDLCSDVNYYNIMKTVCPKTCNLCGGTTGNSNSNVILVTTTAAGSVSTCVDQDTTECEKKKHLCANSLYKSLMNEKCPATCGFCTTDNILTTSTEKVAKAAVFAARKLCADLDTTQCETKKQLCTNSLYRDLMVAKCPETCGFC
ncbi:unnamed protein product [Enterobius vermicularis]|uniref:ShTK domain protein n=1 Tax=Enterobius vermicularis TaxID=51028 RepID=A0A0N4VHH1_ENTVE|nr:unnamed protein product [Enterobius vermicularis]